MPAPGDGESLGDFGERVVTDISRIRPHLCPLPLTMRSGHRALDF